jgi:hypothetical protein
LSLCLFPAKAQNFWDRYWESLTADEANDGNPSFIIYPTVAFAPETSWEFGFSSLYLYYANRDTSNRLSEFNAFTFYTVENQYGLWLDHANYGNKDKYMFLGRLRFQSFPLFYHGIGRETPAEPLALIDARYLLWKEHFLKRIKGYWYGGIYTDIQSLPSPDLINQTTLDYDLPLGIDGSFNFGIGLSTVYDDRRNVLNVRDGNFAELSFLRYHPNLGSDFDFTSVLLDARFFRPINKRDVLAWQVLGQFIDGDAPFHMLSLMGGESIMRGYYYGRFRDNNLLATQLEYRMLPFSFAKRWGASFFMAAGQVFPEADQLQFNQFKLSGGGGLRFLIFPQKDIYTRLDFAFTEEGPGFYFFIGEAF